MSNEQWKFEINEGAVELILRGYPQDQGNCPLNGGWAGVC